MVRSWLIANVHQVLVGIDSGYSQGRPRAVVSGSPRQRNNWDRDPIFHVEHWAIASAAQAQSSSETLWWFARGLKDVLPIPREPRLYHQAGKDRKDCINIDVIVVNPGSRIVDAIDNIDICKCKFDGHNFTIPNPKDAIARRMELASSPEASDVFRYAAGIAKESKKSIQAMLRDVVVTPDDEDEDEYAQTVC